jgi:hypothetical protein
MYDRDKKESLPIVSMQELVWFHNLSECEFLNRNYFSYDGRELLLLL